MNYENELVIRAKSGDPNALNLLLDNNKSYIYAIAFSLLKNHEDAEDAVQKTMIAVWQSIGSLENTEAFKSWLYRIAHTRSLNILQSRKKEHVVLDDDISDMPQIAEMESELMLPQAYAERGDLRDRLNRIIDGLSAVQRETIVLYYFSDRSIAEIAEIMDCSENTVKSRLYLARNSIRTEIEEQERKSGEKFYGIAIGALPIGYFVTEHIKHCLPSSELLGNLVSSAQQAGQSAASQAANGASVSGKVGSAAAKTAVKGMPTAVKAVIATVGIAAVAASGVMTARLITNGQQDDDITPVETQAIVETAAPTAAPTKAPTEAPTEPDYTDAYRAYLEELENNKSDIKAYDWQASGGSSKPIVFEDIMGDDTPEMIYVYADEIFDRQQEHNMGTAGIRVFTYLNGRIKKAYEKTDWTQNYAQVADEPYLLFQKQDDKALYAYLNTSKSFMSFKILRFSDNGNGSLSEETAVDLFYGMQNDMGMDSGEKAEKWGESVTVSEAEQEAKDLIESKSTALMVAAVDNDRYRDRNLKGLSIDPSTKDNQAMTYDEAVAYLKGLIGEISDDSSDKEDYSVIADTYTATFSRHYSAELTIHEDGSFESIYYFDPASGVISNRDPAEYSLCHGKIVDLTEIGSGVYTFHVADVSYDYHVGDSGNVTYYDRREKTERSMYASFIKQPIATDGEMTLYTKGTMPADMRGSHFKSYVYPDDPNTSERANTPIPYNIIYIPYGSTDHPYYGQ